MPGSGARTASIRSSVARTLLLLAAAVALGATAGCQTGTRTYASDFPPFVLEYPGRWHLEALGRTAGQELLFSRQAEPGEEDARVLVHLQRVERMDDLLPGHYQVDIRLPEGWQGRRYIILRSPLTPVIESYAPAAEFEETDRLAQNIAQQLARQFPMPQETASPPGFVPQLLPPPREEEELPQ